MQINVDKILQVNQDKLLPITMQEIKGNLLQKVIHLKRIIIDFILEFCVAIRRDSVSLLKFLLLRHVQVFSLEISSVCRLKYSYSCFSFYFSFLVVDLLIIILSVLFLVTVISLSLLFFI